MFANIVLSGGGLGAIAYFGSYKYICETIDLKKTIKNVLGVSAGAFFSLFFILDFTFPECYQFINILKTFDMKNITVRNFLELKRSYGLDDGKKLIEIIKIIYDMKNVDYNITFNGLAKRSGKNMIIATANVTKQELFYFCVDNTPEAVVLEAVKASASIPFLFVPFLYNEEYHVDAFIYNNFPIEYFQNALEQTFGLNLVTKQKKINGLFSFMQSVLDSVIYVNSKCNYKNECKIYTNGNGFNPTKMKFDFNDEQTEIDIHNGYNSLKDFIQEKLNKIEQIPSDR
jgi:predicted acylesterase/phospholipase RssA